MMLQNYYITSILHYRLTFNLQNVISEITNLLTKLELPSSFSI